MSISKPLEGVRVVEFEAIGPVPVAGYMLREMGASVTLVSRPHGMDVVERLAATAGNPLNIGKERIPLDIKSSETDRATAMTLVAEADVLLEGLRPGTMERLSLGPADCARVNSKLIYARMTGWGQDGPLASAAGHDLNYVALTGLLSLSARPGEKPILPPTVVGDGAGALGMAFGIACALLDVRQTGRGRIIDAAIVDITAMCGLLAQWNHSAGQLATGQVAPLLGSPFYEVYECSDGKLITIGCIEPQFYALLLSKLGLEDVDASSQYDAATWTEMSATLSAVFKRRTRNEWCAILEGTDVCFAPVLDVAEAPAHPHNVARGTFQATETGATLARGAPRYAPLPEV